MRTLIEQGFWKQKSPQTEGLPTNLGMSGDALDAGDSGTSGLQ
jgi:hypothetical protein